MDERSNVVHLSDRRLGKPDLAGSFVEPSDVRELVCLMCEESGETSLVFTPTPPGCVGWRLIEADRVERLGCYLIELSARMRGAL